MTLHETAEFGKLAALWIHWSEIGDEELRRRYSSEMRSYFENLIARGFSQTDIQAALEIERLNYEAMH